MLYTKTNYSSSLYSNQYARVKPLYEKTYVRENALYEINFPIYSSALYRVPNYYN